MERLLKSEARRLFAVYDSTIERWASILQLSNDLFQSSEVQFDQVFGPDAAAKLLAYDQQRQSVIELHTSLERAKEVGALSRAGQIQQHLDEATKQLRDTAIALSHYLVANPQIVQSVQELRRSRILPAFPTGLNGDEFCENTIQPTAEGLLATIRVQRQLTAENLATGARQAMQRQRDLSLLVTREQKLRAQVGQLEQQLQRQQSDAETEAAASDTVIRHFEKLIHGIQEQAQLNVSSHHDMLKSATDQECDEMDKQIEALEAQVAKLESALEEKQKATWENERNLQQLITREAEDLTQLLDMYDDTMLAEDTEVYALEAERRDIEAKSSVVRGHIGELETALAEQHGLDEAARLQREQHEASTAAERRAALIIQSRWRGYAARREVAKMKRLLQKPTRKRRTTRRR